MLSLLCFVAGGLVGWGTSVSGPRVQRAWPVVLRTQILLTSATLSRAAAWRLTSARELLGPIALAAGASRALDGWRVGVFQLPAVDRRERRFRFLILFPHTAMSHHAPRRACERS